MISLVRLIQVGGVSFGTLTIFLLCISFKVHARDCSDVFDVAMSTYSDKSTTAFTKSYKQELAKFADMTKDEFDRGITDFQMLGYGVDGNTDAVRTRVWNDVKKIKKDTEYDIDFVKESDLVTSFVPPDVLQKAIAAWRSCNNLDQKLDFEITGDLKDLFVVKLSTTDSSGLEITGGVDALGSVMKTGTNVFQTGTTFLKGVANQAEAAQIFTRVNPEESFVIKVPTNFGIFSLYGAGETYIAPLPGPRTIMIDANDCVSSPGSSFSSSGGLKTGWVSQGDTLKGRSHRNRTGSVVLRCDVIAPFSFSKVHFGHKGYEHSREDTGGCGSSFGIKVTALAEKLLDTKRKIGDSTDCSSLYGGRTYTQGANERVLNKIANSNVITVEFYLGDSWSDEIIEWKIKEPYLTIFPL